STSAAGTPRRNRKAFTPNSQRCINAANAVSSPHCSAFIRASSETPSSLGGVVAMRGGWVQVECGGRGVIEGRHARQDDGEIPPSLLAADHGGDPPDVFLRACDALLVHGPGLGGRGSDLGGRGVGGV